MKELTEEKTYNQQIREDYTDLRSIYAFKICFFIAIALLTIMTLKDGIREFAISTIIYLTGIIFDFIVIQKQNKGPKKKFFRFFCSFCKYVTLVIILLNLILFIGNELGTGNINSCLKLINIVSILAFGISSPLIELILNKPNDD